MEMVTQLWNLTNALVKTESSGANNLRNHYIQCCRDLCDNVELPKNIFGPGTMCSHCGSLWRTVNQTVRINKSKNQSRAIRKLMRCQGNDQMNLSNFKKKLIDKCIKSQNNQLVITCSVCHKKTRINLVKPKREVMKIRLAENDKVQQNITKKKKKKKNRDKTAGLIINTPTNSATSTPQKSQLNNFTKKAQKITPVHQSKKINICKLKGMLNTTVMSAKKPNLHSFLSKLG
uniref:CoaE protein n=1 Tax=Fopius arisanus TaxID=64838 RepID=A0A0C9QIQ4_9HYME